MNIGRWRLVVMLGIAALGLAACGGGSTNTPGDDLQISDDALNTTQSKTAGDTASNALAEVPADEDVAVVLNETMDVVGDDDLVSGGTPGAATRATLPTLEDLSLPNLPFNRKGLTFDGDFTKQGTLQDPLSFSAGGSLTVTSASGTNLTVNTTAGNGSVAMTINDGVIKTDQGTYGVNANVTLNSDPQQAGIEELLKSAGSESPSDAALDQTVNDLLAISGDGDAIGGFGGSGSPGLIQSPSFPVDRSGVTFTGNLTKTGTIGNPSTFSAVGTVTATSPSGTNLTLTATTANGTVNLKVVGGTIVTPTASYAVDLDITLNGSSTNEVITIMKNGVLYFSKTIRREASGVVSARTYTISGQVYVAADPPAGRATDVPEWLQATYTNVTVSVNVLAGTTGVTGGAATVSLGDTPSGSAQLSFSDNSLTGKLTVNGVEVGTLIIQPPLVILVPNADVGGGTSATKKITVTRNGQTVFMVDTVRTATGVPGNRTYTLNGTAKVWSGQTSTTEDLPEWIQLTYTNLVFTVSALTQSASLVSGKVKMAMGDSPSGSVDMSVSKGSFSGTLTKDGKAVANVKYVNGLIVVTPPTGS